MTGTAVRQVAGWEALDSRGRPTVGCRVTLAGGGTGRVVVPSGKSTGGHEAHERRDGGARYGGFGARAAVASVNGALAEVVTGLDAADRTGLDQAMVEADGDEQLANLGANAVLAVSLAVLLALADQAREPLWRMLGPRQTVVLPRPMVNVISGGAHAGGALDLQDVLVVPAAPTFSEALERCARVRAGTAQVLRRGGAWTDLVADEGGLAAGLPTNEAALAAVTEGACAAGLEPGRHVSFALDLAANQFYGDGRYNLRLEGESLDATAWTERLAQWCERYELISIEDVLHEDDWAGWSGATRRLGDRRQVLGDDLFATNLSRLRRGISMGAANAVLVKPNQAGTVSRAEAVVREARQAGYATVVSARSGDTEDHWLADLAVGWQAGQIKVGSTQRSERTAKWNRLLEIEAELGPRAVLWAPGR